MAKRLFDLIFGSIMAIITLPIVAVSALMVFLSDPGPVFYTAQRAGLNGALFPLYKLRSMRRRKPGQEGSVISAGSRDPRVFAFGRFIRLTKIDELPQFWNVILGHVSVVGPRPEDPKIVETLYTDYDRRTLKVRPGLASPGSIYSSTHGDLLVGEDDPERDYAEKMLPIKLSIEQVYIDRMSLAYDLSIIGRTISLIVQSLAGRKTWPDPPEMAAAQSHLAKRGTKA